MQIDNDKEIIDLSSEKIAYEISSSTNPIRIVVSGSIGLSIRELASELIKNGFKIKEVPNIETVIGHFTPVRLSEYPITIIEDYTPAKLPECPTTVLTKEMHVKKYVDYLASAVLPQCPIKNLLKEIDLEKCDKDSYNCSKYLEPSFGKCLESFRIVPRGKIFQFSSPKHSNKSKKR